MTKVPHALGSPVAVGSRHSSVSGNRDPLMPDSHLDNGAGIFAFWDERSFEYAVAA